MENACTDIPRLSDWEYSEIFWGESQPVVFPKTVTIADQWYEWKYRMSCTRQAMAHISNGQNIIEWVWENVHLAFQMWDEYLKKDPDAIRLWATLQSSLDQFLSRKIISWYSVVRRVDEAKDALDAWRFIFTGSQNGDWRYVRSNKEYRLRTDWRTMWHAFAIVWYDGDDFIGLNSYGKDNWYFRIPSKLFNTLFTRYAISDFRDREIINNHHQTMNDKEWMEAQALGIWNGERSTDPVTRLESAKMTLRALKIQREDNKKIEEAIKDIRTILTGISSRLWS